jgi:type I restriction enzyme M protein
MVAEWGKKWWFADIEAIRDQGFNLSAGRYRPITQAATEHRDPVELLDELRGIEAEILDEVDELVQILRNRASEAA